MRTNSDLASIESANEAGRRAARAILERRGIWSAPEIWSLSEPAAFEPFKRQDRVRYRLGFPHPAAVTQSVRQSITSLVDGGPPFGERFSPGRP